MKYRVTWEIDVDEENPIEAVKRAREIQLDVGSIATVFSTQRLMKNGKPYKNAALTFDLLEMGGNRFVGSRKK
jgi:hypothetical protein